MSADLDHRLVDRWRSLRLPTRVLLSGTVALSLSASAVLILDGLTSGSTDSAQATSVTTGLPATTDTTSSTALAPPSTGFEAPPQAEPLSCRPPTHLVVSGLLGVEEGRVLLADAIKLNLGQTLLIDPDLCGGSLPEGSERFDPGDDTAVVVIGPFGDAATACLSEAVLVRLNPDGDDEPTPQWRVVAGTDDGPWADVGCPSDQDDPSTSTTGMTVATTGGAEVTGSTVPTSVSAGRGLPSDE